MRTVFGMVLVSIVIAACGPTHGGRTPTQGDMLYEAVTSSGTPAIVVVETSAHAIVRRLPLGVPSRDWKHLYSILGTGLVDTDPVTGDTSNVLQLGGDYQLPAATNDGLPGGTSPAGYWLVVQSHDSTTTRMLVIDATRFKVADRIQLTGRFNFDAISDDGQRLYLIQYLNGKEYYVRQFDIATNSLDANIVVDKSDGNQAMAGLRLSGIAAPDGSMLFSMYVREQESPFIHALNLSGPFAFCLDLPGSGYSQWSMAMTRDGSRLYAVSRATGVVAELDTSNQYSPQLITTAHVATGASASAVSSDGKTLVTAGSSGLAWIDTSSLRVRMVSLADWRLSSLGVSPDGKILYAVADNGRVAQVSMASGELISAFDPASGTPTALLRVAAA